MDRKGWIILILCSVALVFNYNVMKSNSEEQAKIEQERLKLQEEKVAQVAKAAKAAEAGDAAVTSENAVAAEQAQQEEIAELIAVTDGEQVIKYTFSNIGGGIKTAEMLNEEKVFEDEKVTINEYGDNVIGALAKDYKKIEKTFYTLSAKTGNSLTYTGELQDGVAVTKTWILEEGTADKAPMLKLTVSFTTAAGKIFDLGQYSITSGSALPVFVKEQVNLAGWFYYADGDYENEDHGDFTGGFFSDAKPVTEITVEALEYFGVNSQFFGTAIFPHSDAKSTTLWAAGKEIEIVDGDKIKGGKTGKRWQYVVGLNLPSKSMGAGQTTSLSYDIFVGSKKHKQMAAISDLSTNSDDIMNFSMFSIFGWISGGMNSALNWIHEWFPEGAAWSWGLAIMILTFLIRVVIWPLHNKSTRTMKRMSKLQPIMKGLREKHKDNPQKLNQETMKLYREYGVNPMGGCLPMLVQIPIFFGVFNMINAAVELRGQPFLWVDDLSQPDTIGYILGLPINILPIVMAVTMVLQMRMTPQTGDKLQRRIFMLMPLMFFFFCYNYAAALALYWSTQNIVSIGQTWLTQRMPEPELEKREGKPPRGTTEVVDDGKPRKKGFMERMAEKLEEAQNQRDIAAGKAPAMKKKEPGQLPEKKAKKRTPKTGG